jgi:hypothetical protein
MRKLAGLKPSPFNPREITDEALAGLRTSIARYGLVQPLVVNRKNDRVIGGHQRLKALLEAGVDEAPVVLVELNAIDEKALNVSLNSPEIQGRFTGDVTQLLRQVSDGLGAAFMDLRLDALLEQTAPPEPTAPDDFPGFTRDVKVDYQCPKCGYEWAGKPS